MWIELFIDTHMQAYIAPARVKKVFFFPSVFTPCLFCWGLWNIVFATKNAILFLIIFLIHNLCFVLILMLNFLMRCLRIRLSSHFCVTSWLCQRMRYTTCSHTSTQYTSRSANSGGRHGFWRFCSFLWSVLCWGQSSRTWTGVNDLFDPHPFLILFTLLFFCFFGSACTCFARSDRMSRIRLLKWNVLSWTIGGLEDSETCVKTNLANDSKPAKTP